MQRSGERPSRADAVAAGLALSASVALGLLVVRQGPSVGIALVGVLALAALAATFPKRITLAAGCVAIMIGVPGSLALGPSLAVAWRMSLVLAVGYLVLTFLGKARNEIKLRWTLPDAALALYLLVVLLSWWVRAPDLSWTVLLSVVGPAVIYAMARAIPRDDMRLILWVALTASAVGAITIFMETSAGRVIFSSSDPNAYSWNKSASGRNAFRPAGVFGSPPAAAATLFSSVFACYSLYFSPDRIQATIARCLGIACGIGGLLVFTRAPTIGFLIGAGLIVVLRTKTFKEAGRTALAIGLAAIMALQFAPVIGAGFSRSNDTFAQRQGFWTASVPLITESSASLALGHGPLNLLLRSRSGQTVPASMGTSQLINWSVHNYLIQTAIDTGLAGLILMITWLVTVLVAGIDGSVRARRIRPPPDTYGLGPALVVFVSGLMASAYTTPGDLFPLALWAGLAVSVRPVGGSWTMPRVG